MAGTEIVVDEVFKHECGPDAQCEIMKNGRCVLNGQWCFWDEAYNIHGPFESEHHARLSLVEYCHVELG